MSYKYPLCPKIFKMSEYCELAEDSKYCTTILIVQFIVIALAILSYVFVEYQIRRVASELARLRNYASLQAINGNGRPDSGPENRHENRDRVRDFSGPLGPPYSVP